MWVKYDTFRRELVGKWGSFEGYFREQEEDEEEEEKKKLVSSSPAPSAGRCSPK